MAASARIDELRSKFDDNPRRFFAPLANEYRKAGDLETAIAICRTQLRQHPSHMSGYVVLGQALYEAGELADARSAFSHAVDLDAENLIALRHLGDIARDLGDAPAARAWYGRVLDADPQNRDIAAYLADLSEPPLAPELEVQPTPVLPGLGSSGPELDLVDLSSDDFSGDFVGGWDVVEPARASVALPEPTYGFDPVVGLDLVPPDDVGAALLAHADASLTPLSLDVADESREEPARPPRVFDPASTGADTASDADTLETVVSGAFVTETMAELCVQQGHEERALDIYERLAEQRPDDAALAERTAALRARLRPSAAPVLESDETGDTAAPTASLVTRAPSPHEASSTEPRLPPDERTVWAADAWAGAFRDAAAPSTSLVDEARTSRARADQSADLTFDRFFVGHEEQPATPPLVPATPEPPLMAKATERVPLPAEEPASAARDTEEDLAEFNAWLKGLGEP